MPRLIGSAQSVTTQAQQITTFNSSGTFTAQPLSYQADILVIAGGGDGAGQLGGGGGAGGYREISDHPIPTSDVPVTIGAGGTGATSVTRGADGNNTVFGASSPLTSTAGGGGGRANNPDPNLSLIHI